MHFGIKLPESGENRPDFGMSPTYGSDSKLKGYEKSGKHRKVEELIVKGEDIQILSESDFLKIVSP